MDLCPSPRQQELIDLAHRLAVDNFAPRAAVYDREASFPFADYDDLRAAGLLALCIPERYGGLGATFETYCLVAEHIAQREGYRLSHIPYKGAGPALADLVAGHVKLGTMTFSTAAPQIRGAKVIPLAVTSEARIPSFPDLPALKEVGPDLVAATWFGLSGPARLPNEIVQQISRETLRAMQLPQVQRRLALDAIESRSMSPVEFTKFIETETSRWAPLARSLAASTPQK